MLKTKGKRERARFRGLSRFPVLAVISSEVAQCSGGENTQGPAYWASRVSGTRPFPNWTSHWEPSPRDVVAEMLKVADVRADDVLFDLGCGDGRIVVEAAKQRGARGVGVDLDPRRIKESLESTERAGVRDDVRFLNEDLFESDIHEATVVTLFLFPNVNMRLRSKLLADLKPGTRIVSYCHNMERWMPDHSVRIKTNYLYCWVVPENISGKWEGVTQGDEEAMPVRLTPPGVSEGVGRCDDGKRDSGSRRRGDEGTRFQRRRRGEPKRR